VQPTANGDWNDLWDKQNLEQIIGEQLSVQGNFKTGQIKHQLFTGVDMENSFTSIHWKSL
jgi:iron complex outermembrane receptor protein